MNQLRSASYGFVAGVGLIAIGMLVLGKIQDHRKSAEIAKHTEEMLHSSYYHCQDATDPRTCVFDPDAYLESQKR